MKKINIKFKTINYDKLNQSTMYKNLKKKPRKKQIKDSPFQF